MNKLIIFNIYYLGPLMINMAGMCLFWQQDRKKKTQAKFEMLAAILTCKEAANITELKYLL